MLLISLSLIKKEKFKKYLILGDMLELGSKSKKYHEDLSKVINNSDIDKVFIKGKETVFAYKHLNKEKRGNILQNIEDIDFSLSKMISNNDYLMIKGSNAMGLNDFTKKMIKGI
jgi:murE/murF fusion protein